MARQDTAGSGLTSRFSSIAGTTRSWRRGSRMSRWGRLAGARGGWCPIDQLENRTLLTAIAWDGGAGDNLWHSAGNWGGDVVPGSADDVTIDAGASTIQFNSASGSRTINSLMSARALAVSGGTLAVTTSATMTAALSLSGGTINGGAWDVSGGSFTATGTTAALSAVTLTGTLNLAASNARLTITSGLTLSGTVNITGSSAALMFVGGTQTISGAGIIALEGAGTHYLTGENGAAVTIGAGITIRGGNGVIASGQFIGGAGTFTNQGTIQADVAAQSISISPSTFNNDGGTFNLANGGTIVVSRTIGNTGSTLTLAGSGGAVQFSGAGITGGSVGIGENVALSFTNNTANIFSGVSITGNFDITGSSTKLVINNGLTLNGTVTVSGSSAALIFNGGTQTFGGNATVVFSGAGSHYLTAESSVILTLAPTVTVRGGNGLLSSGVFIGGNGTFVNQGTLSADVAAQSITINPTTFTNDAGTFSLANGGTIVINRTIGNTGSTLTLNGTGGTVQVSGAGITGGTVNIGASVSFSFTNNTANIFSGVTVNGNLDITGSSTKLVITSGLTLNGTITVSGSSAALIFNGGTQSFSGSGTVLFTGAGTHYITAESGATVSFGSQIHILGQNGYIASAIFIGGSGTFVNQGLIESDVSGSTTTIAATSFTNAGTLRVTNSGTIAINSAGANSGGTYTLDTGTITLSGAFTNAASTMTINGSAGAFRLSNGSISGGTISVASTTTLEGTSSNSNTLSGVTVDGNITLSASSGRISVTSGLTLNGTAIISGSGAALMFVGGNQTFNGTGAEVLFQGAGTHYLSAENGGTVTLSSSVHVHGQNGNIGSGIYIGGIGTIISQGLVESDVAGSTITIAPTLFTNAGTLLALTGSTIQMTGTASVVNGTFTVNGGIINLGGTITLGSTTMTVNGTGGAVNLNGGTISGGTLVISDPALFVVNTSTNNRLTGIAVTGDLNLSIANAFLRVRDSFSISGTVTLSGSSAILHFDNTLTMSAGTILFSGITGGRRQLRVEGNANVTLGPSVAIEGGFADIGEVYNIGAAHTLTLQGTLTSSVSGQSINFASGYPFTFNNEGTITTDAGTTLNINASTWSNTGSIVVNSAILNLGGTFSSPGSITRTGTTTVNLNGTFNNTGNTFTFDSSTGSWLLNGGTISGGTINLTQGAGLIIPSNGSNRLLNVTVNGELQLSQSSALLKIEGTTTFTTARLTGDYSGLGFGPGTSITGEVILDGPGTGYRVIEMNGTSGTVTIAPTGIIRTGSTFAGTGYIGWAYHFGGNMTLVNEGLLSAEAANKNLYVQPLSLTNQGTLQALTGGILHVIATNWSNAGLINAVGATINLGGTSWTNTGVINADGATINLGGTFTSPGSITRSGVATVNLTGTFDNTGSTFTFDSSTGSWVLSGGTISGGTINFTGGAGLIISGNGSNRLLNVTVNGELLLSQSSALLRIEGSTTFTTARLTGDYSGLSFAPGTSISGEVIFDGPGTGYRVVEMNGTAGTLTIAPTGIIRTGPTFAGTGYIGYGYHFGGNMTLVNEGLISAETSNKNLYVQPLTFSNQGLAQSLNNSNLNLAGAFTLASSDTLVAAGGNVNIQGTLNNAGQTTILSQETGSWTLAGGNISGGTLEFSDGQTLLLPGNNSSRLTGVTVNSDLILSASSARLRIEGGTTFATARLSGDYSSIAFAPGQTLTGTIWFEGPGTGYRVAEMNGTSGTFTIAATGAIRTAANFGGTGYIGYGYAYGGNMTLINDGLISAETSGKNIYVQPFSMTNQGTLQAISGGVLNAIATNWTNTGSITATDSTLTLGGNWSNAGAITATNSTVNLGGTFTNTGTLTRTGGIVNLTGTLNNTGQTTTLDASTGSWTLAGGTISGGSLVFTDGQTLLLASNGNNRLTGVTVTGDLMLSASSARLRIEGGTTFTAARLSGDYSSIAFAPGQTLVGTIWFEGPGTGYRVVEMNGISGTFTIGAAGAIRTAPNFGGTGYIGYGYAYGGNMTLINEGLISSETSNKNLYVQPLSMTNQGTLQALSGGILHISATTWTNAGVINVAGATINLGGTFTSPGTITRTGGVINITGTLNNAGNTFTVDDSLGSVNLSGGTISGGTLNLVQNQAGGSWGPGQFDNAATVDGIDAYAVTPNLRDLFPTETVTIELWFRPLTAGVVVSELGVPNPENPTWHDSQIEVLDSGQVRARIWSLASLSLGQITFGEWNHAVLRYNRTTQMFDGFLNGVVTATQVTGDRSSPWESGYNLHYAFGAGDTTNMGSGRYFTGDVDEVRIWNVARTDQEITDTWNTQVAGNEAGLVAYYKLDETTGTIGADSSPSGRNLTVFNAGTTLNITSNGNNRLTGVTVTGDLYLSVSSARLRIEGGTTFERVHMIGDYSSLGFAPGQTLTGTILMEGGGTGYRVVEMNGTSGTFTIGATGEIRSASNFGGTGYVGLGYGFGGNMTLINQGLIGSDAAGRTISVQPFASTNTGNLRASSGGILSLSGTWTSASGTFTVDAGTFNLGSTFTPADLGTTVRTGGTINLTGTLNNVGTTLNLDASTGSWTLAGGTINGGTVTMTSGATLIMSNNSNNRLTAATINGDLDLTLPSAWLRVRDGLVLNGTATLGGTDARIVFENTQVVSAGTFVFSGTNGSPRDIRADGGSTLTFGPAVTIRGGYGYLYTGYFIGGPSTIINEGTIVADAAGQTLTIQPSFFTNAGTVGAHSSGTLTLSTTWSNTGIISSVSSPVNLGGTFTSTGTLQGTDTIFNLTGTLNNVGGTLNLDAASGSLNLVGGTITGGTVSATAGATLRATGNSNSRLTAVTVNGNIDLTLDNAWLRVRDGLTLNGTAFLGGSSARIIFDNTQSVANGTFVFQGTNGGLRELRAEGGTTLTLSSTVTVHGGNGALYTGYFVGGPSTIVNQGTIVADTSGQQIYIQVSNLTNAGTLRATANSVLNLQGATLNTAGLFLADAGGTLNFSAALTNTGETLTLDGATGTFALSGGNIVGGIVNMTNAAVLHAVSNGSNRLTGTTVSGDIVLDAGSARLRIEGGATFTRARLSGAYSSIGFAPGSVLSGEILFEGANGGYRVVEMNGTAGTFTIGPSGSVRMVPGFTGTGYIGLGYAYGGTMTLDNQGLISAEISGYTLSVQPGSVTNNGTMQVINNSRLELYNLTANTANVIVGAGTSTLYVSGNYVQSGGATTLQGGTFDPTGTLNINAGIFAGVGSMLANVTNAGTISPGGASAAGTLAITGTFTQTATGTLDIELGGLTQGTQYDRLSISGAATLDGTFHASLIGGFFPIIGDTFQSVGFASRGASYFANVTGLDIGMDRLLQLVANATNLTLITRVGNDTTAPTVSGVAITATSIQIAYADLGGMDPATVTNPVNYTLLASGGDGTFGEPNDVNLNSRIQSIAFDGITSVATITLSPALGNDLYQLTINGQGVRDAAGNPIGADYVTTLSLSTTPATAVIDLQAASDSGLSATDNITNITTPTFDVTVNRSGQINLDINGDGNAEVQFLAPGAGTYSITSPMLGDGITRASIRFVPAVGSFVTTFLDVRIDTHGPTVNVGAATAQAPYAQRSITFSEQIDASSIATADILVYMGVTQLGQATSLSGNGFTYTVGFAPIVTPGAYSLRIGPGIADIAGNVMNIDGDASPGEPEDYAADSFTLLVDTTRPTISMYTPSAPVNMPVSSVQVTFSEWMNAGSFTPSDVSISTPTGPIDPANISITPMETAPGSGLYTTFTILFPSQNSEGTYTLTIGPDVTDLAGNAMLAASNASFTIDVTGPRVLSISPTDLNTAFSFVDVTFDSTITQASFTSADVTFLAPGGGTISISSVTRQSNTVYRVNFVSQAAPGAYSITIGPGITDLAANAMDQDADGTPGEPGQDAFVGQISVALPDLVVDAVTLQPIVSWGEVVHVQWTVRNAGANTAVADWSDRIYVSTNPTFDAGDFLFASLSAANQTPLAPGASYTLSMDATIPSLASGNFYVLIVADGTLQQAETNEGNNVFAVPVLVTASDLTVDNVQPAATGVFGQNITVNYTVHNVGDGAATGSWTDQVWLSADGVIGAGDFLLTSVPSTGVSPLVSGDTYTRSVQAPLPLNAALFDGHYNIIVRTNSGSTQAEYSTANNTRTAGVDLTLPPLPDLTVTNILAPATAYSGERIEIEWTVTNQGSGPATGTWSDTLYLSTDQVVGNDQSFGSFSFSGTINAGQSVTRRQIIQLPLVYSGVHYVIVTADSSGQLFEHAAEGNNTSVDDAALAVTLADFPNLHVASIDAPSNVFSGQVTQIDWVVTNSGAAATTAPIWYDSVYLSLDQIFDGTDLLLSTVANANYLNAAESYNSTTTVTIPVGIAGTRYFLVRTDVYNQVFENTGENDNILTATATTVTLTPPPNLEVSTVSAPAIAFSGDAVSVSFTISNTGPGRTVASFWSDQVYLSSDDTIGAGDVLLGTFAHSGELLSTQSYSRTVNLTMPVGISGSYFFIVRADSGNQVFEAAFESDNTGFDPVATAVQLTPPPDLETSDVDAPSTGITGASIVVGYTVTNFGATATPNTVWSDAFYLSSDTTFSAGTDYLLGERVRSGALESEGSYTRSFTFTVPAGLSGNYYLLVVADSGNVVFELDNANNVGFDAGPVTITNSNPPPPPPPPPPLFPADLVLSGITAEAAGQAGRSFLVNWSVNNSGTGPTNSTFWFDHVILSTDNILGNSNDTTLLAARHDGTLNVSQSYSRTGVPVLLPQATLPGNYFVFFVTDAGNVVGENAFGEANNASQAFPLTITRSTADLSVTQAIAPVSAPSGQPINVAWTVQNDGTVRTSSENWYDDVYLSSDTTIGAGDLFLGRVYRSAGLDPSAAYSGSGTFNIPIDFSGTYHVVVRTDAFNNVTEDGGDSNNDTASLGTIDIALSPVPDLAVTNVDAPTSGVSGQLVPIQWTVQNVGAAATPTSWYDSIYLSLDQVFDRNTDTFLGFQTHSGSVAPGASYTQNGSFSIPAGLSGPYYIFVNADGGGSVYERAAELNNVSYDVTPMSVILAPPADLVAGTITIPANSSPGQTVTITYTITNQGSSPAVGSWYDALYISSNDTWDLNDPLFGRFFHSGDVAPGGNYTGSVTAPLPGVLPGDYHVIVRSDIRNAVQEPNENNNFGASMEAFGINPQTLELDTPAAGTLGKGESVFYQITVNAGETLLLKFNSASSTASNELFASFGAMPRRSDFDFSFSDAFSPDQEIVVPITRAGTYFIMAYGADTVLPAAFTITAELLQFEIRRVGLTTISNAGEVTIPVEGAQFQYDTVFRLHAGATTRDAIRATFADTTKAYATFDTTGLAPGSYTLEAERIGVTVSAMEQVTVVTGQQGHITGRIIGPAALRFGATDLMQVAFGNEGLTDVPIPLIRVSSPSNSPFALTGRTPRPQTLVMLALSPDGPSEVLRPGQQILVPLQFRAQALNTGFSVDFVEGTDTSPLNLNSLFPRLRPPGIGDTEWNQAVATLLARIDGRDSIPGATVGELVRFLGESAHEQAAAGRTTVDPAAILSAQVRDVLGIGQATLESQILDSTTGRPLAGILIQAVVVSSNTLQPGFYRTVVSDDAGKFDFRNFPDGTYQLTSIGAVTDEPVTITIAQGVSVAPFVIEATPNFTDATFDPRAGGNVYNGNDAANRGLSQFAYNGPGTPLPPGYTAAPGVGNNGYIEGTNGFAAWALQDSNGNLVIAFRGTDGANDAIVDAGLGRPQWYSDGGQPNAQAILDVARDWAANNPGGQITTTGHSLGGGLAQFAAYELARQGIVNPSQINTYTYNSLGGVAGIEQQYGSYNPNLINGADIRNWGQISDMVTRAGDGHVGGPPTMVGTPMDIGAAHSIATFPDTVGNTGPVLTPGDYLGVQLTQMLGNFVAQFGNFFPNDSSSETYFRILATAGITTANILNNPILQLELGDALANVLANLAQTAGWSQGMVDFLRDGPIIPALTMVAANLLSPILTVPALIAGTVGIVGAVITDLYNGLAPIVADFFTETLPNFIQDVQDAIGEQIDNLTQAIEDGWNSAVETAQEVAEALQDAFNEVADAVTDFVNDAIDTASDFVEDVADAITDTADAIADWVGDRVNDAADFVQDRLNDLSDLADNVGDAIGDFFDDLGDFLNPFNYLPDIIVARDPNDIIGPVGFGEQHWVTANETLNYTIRFENDPEFANGPAQTVRITQQLDADLDWRTFRVGDFGFGNVVIDVPDNRSFYQTRLDLTEDYGIFLDYAAGIDIATGEAFWQFTSVDPVSGEEPRDPNAGFLPPNITEPEGEGFVKYSARARRTAPSGSLIDAQARIIFDINEPIDTPAIANAIDSGKPSSSVEALPNKTAVTTFTVRWSGTDEATGSGLAGFNIYVKTDNGDYALWLENTTLTEAEFAAQLDHTYSFYSIATDNAGNTETAPSAPDATIAVQLPQLATVASLQVNDGSAQRSMVTSLTITFSAPVTLDSGALTLFEFGNGNVTLDIANPSGDQQTYFITFSGPGIVAGSLADGNYRLTVHHELVHDLYGRELSGGDYRSTIYRLFADSDGDRDVDALDLARLRGSLGAHFGDINFLPYFDYDGDGDVDGIDFGQGRSRLNTILDDPFLYSPPGARPPTDLRRVPVIFDFLAKHRDPYDNLVPHGPG